MSPASAASFFSCLKNRSRGRQATRTLSTAFPNSRSRTSPRSATGIRADARAYKPARDGGLREKACSTAFPGQPAKAEPNRLCETSRRGPHNRRALQRASPRSERRSRPIPHGPAAACSARSEEHTSELQSRGHLVCRLLLEKKKKKQNNKSKITDLTANRIQNVKNH